MKVNSYTLFIALFGGMMINYNNIRGMIGVIFAIMFVFMIYIMDDDDLPNTRNSKEVKK